MREAWTGRRSRRAAFAAVLLAAGALAVLAPRRTEHEREGADSRSRSAGSAGAPGTRTATDPAEPSEADGQDRAAERSDALAAAPRAFRSESAPAPEAKPAADAGKPPDGASAGAGSVAGSDESLTTARLVVGAGLRLRVSLPLVGAPDRSGPNAEPARVAPGAAQEIAFASFVERGAAAIDSVARVVGARKPRVETGVPVSLVGSVLEAEGGAPIEHATVVVTSVFYVRGYRYDHHLEEVARVETGADGVYHIERLNADPAHFGPAGAFYVTVTAAGHAPALAIPVAGLAPGVANRLDDVRLERATQSLAGRVLDVWEGKPVVGAHVYATGSIDPIAYPKDERAALFVGAPTASTDAEGRFVLEGLSARWQIVSVHGGDDCVGSEGVFVPHEGEWLMRTRQIGGRIEGTTVDEHGAPVALVVVAGGENYTHSFGDGRFVLENFRGKVVTLVCTHADYMPVTVKDVPDGATGVIVRLERPQPTVILDARDAESSSPLLHVVVEFVVADPGARPDPTSPHHLSTDGRFPIRVPAGVTALDVSAPGYATTRQALGAPVDGEVVHVSLAKSL